MELPGALTGAAKTVTRLLGKLVGYGLEQDISSAYIFLMQTYDPGDRVFLFGFSRGAYTVRYVSAMIFAYGLLPTGNECLVPYLIRAMSAVKDPDKRLLVAKLVKETSFSRDCSSSFLGVWDTVSSVGWFQNRLMTEYMSYNPSISVGRHALAMDERRSFFEPMTWGTQLPGIPVDFKQVWFPGVHSDVGGGYSEPQSGLSKIALTWMLGEAQTSGLLLDRTRTELVLGEQGSGYVKPDSNAKIHDSMTFAWQFAELLPRRNYDPMTYKMRRRPHLSRRRYIPPGSFVHESAYQRADNYKMTLPENGVSVSSVPLKWSS